METQARVQAAERMRAYIPPSQAFASAESPPVPKRCATAPSWGGDSRMSNVLCSAALSSVGVINFTWSADNTERFRGEDSVVHCEA